MYALARWFNGQSGTELIPSRILTRPPTAELRENQTDQDTLPPYDVLDAILQRYVEHDQPADAIIAAGFDASVVRDVVRRVDRKSAAKLVNIIHITHRDQVESPITDWLREAYELQVKLAARKKKRTKN